MEDPNAPKPQEAYGTPEYREAGVADMKAAADQMRRYTMELRDEADPRQPDDAEAMALWAANHDLTDMLYCCAVMSGTAEGAPNPSDDFYKRASRQWQRFIYWRDQWERAGGKV